MPAPARRSTAAPMQELRGFGSGGATDGGVLPEIHGMKAPAGPWMEYPPALPCSRRWRISPRVPAGTGASSSHGANRQTRSPSASRVFQRKGRCRRRYGGPKGRSKKRARLGGVGGFAQDAAPRSHGGVGAEHDIVGPGFDGRHFLAGDARAIDMRQLPPLRGVSSMSGLMSMGRRCPAPPEALSLRGLPDPRSERTLLNRVLMRPLVTVLGRHFDLHLVACQNPGCGLCASFLPCAR